MKKIIKNWRIASWILIFLGVVIFGQILYGFEWSGFGKTSGKSVSIEEAINPQNGKVIKIRKEIENFQSEKKIWDWLLLAGTLAIPLALLLFQSNQSNEVSENLREEAVRAYFDRMTNLLVDKKYRTELLLNNELNDNPIREVARVNTVMVLRRLRNDTERKNQVLDFLRSANLSNFILKHSNLSGTNLSKNNFYEICFANADLSNADLTEAKLFKANLSRANLSKVKFFAADLRAGNFSGANFSKANLSEAKLNDSNFSCANLTDVNLSRLELNKANLSCANLSGVKLIRANLSGAILSGAKLFKANLSGAILKDTDFSGADLNGAIFANADLLQAKFTDTKNLTAEQVKNVAKNWEKAEYDVELRNQLNL
ncbi:putative protein in mobD 3'region [Planktothrix agardhii]|jgi:uncharacterized protein YjbI with pentapeptide repeats|uniref:pentapeptide repeat-containing protein n=1 Tax=Planktothrix agardhii TaxID=1160 RepID=UPI001D0B78B0|nr:pentapeptide repeat-containing protein [Planktothrix agardhii]MCB8750442.1 pentapeptide repeat-containing protein [Planktothrix agardhii 1810]MCF3606314.1 pentapeptide repeat-containing protein [Planktothrix agardhii 1033]CAD5945579.1 putative protein in mobD 3'region [Planktothrix agardhii]